MEIISWNVNGLRAAHEKGFIDWFNTVNADIVCLQEVKADIGRLPKDLIKMKDYNLYLNSATKKGYSGVAVYSKSKPLSIKTCIEVKRFDEEGRILQLDYRDFILINIYIPHGARDKSNLEYKLKIYKKLITHLKDLNNKPIILVGDFNIAHKEIDLARPRDNKNNIMFTSREREQIDAILNLGFLDTFRYLNKQPGNYTWWPYRGDLRKRNIGWRIDYIFIPKKLSRRLQKAFILNNIDGSDHCPIGVDLKLLKQL